MSAYDFYRTNAGGWGTNQIRFGPPPPVQFQPQPTWGGYDFLRAHSNMTPDPALWQRALGRISSGAPLDPLGVGLNNARLYHHRLFGGLASMIDMLPQEIGHAAAYEAFRIWIHNSQLYEPLSADPLQQREALIGLAVAEAMRLFQNTTLRMDNIGLYPAIEAAAATAAMLFQEVLASEGMGAMGMGTNPAMGGTAGMVPGAAYSGATGALGAAGDPIAGGLGAAGTTSLTNAYMSDYDAPWFTGRRGMLGAGYDNPIQLSGTYLTRSVSPYNVADTSVAVSRARSLSPYNIAGTSPAISPVRSVSPYNVTSASPGAYTTTTTTPVGGVSPGGYASSAAMPIAGTSMGIHPAATTMTTPYNGALAAMGAYPGHSVSPYNARPASYGGYGAAPGTMISPGKVHSGVGNCSLNPMRGGGMGMRSVSPMAPMPVQQQAMFAQQQAMPAQQQAMPAQQQTMPMQQPTMPMQQPIMPMQRQVMPMQQQAMPQQTVAPQMPLVLNSRGQPYAGANTYQSGGNTIIELPSRRRRHHHHHHHHRSRSSEPGYSHHHSRRYSVPGAFGPGAPIAY